MGRKTLVFLLEAVIKTHEKSSSWIQTAVKYGTLIYLRAETFFLPFFGLFLPLISDGLQILPHVIVKVCYTHPGSWRAILWEWPRSIYCTVRCYIHTPTSVLQKLVNYRGFRSGRYPAIWEQVKLYPELFRTRHIDRDFCFFFKGIINKNFLPEAHIIKPVSFCCQRNVRRIKFIKVVFLDTTTIPGKLKLLFEWFVWQIKEEQNDLLFPNVFYIA